MLSCDDNKTSHDLKVMADDKTTLLKGKPNELDGIYYDQSPTSVGFSWSYADTKRLNFKL